MIQLTYIKNFKLNSKISLDYRLSYEIHGEELGTAPVVLVIHALTGNSKVTGVNGWWSSLVGENKVIDTNRYTILAFNIPGNGHSPEDSKINTHYQLFTARDVARLFALGLDSLGISSLYAIMGPSLGGGLVWELAALRPNLGEHVIPIASSWYSCQWLRANCHIQACLLEHSSKPLEDARKHAMTLYRTPESLEQKFNEAMANSPSLDVETWLDYHGTQLSSRFKLSAYKMMNQLLKTIDITRNGASLLEVAKSIQGHIHLVTVDSDLLFKSDQCWDTYVKLKSVKENVSIYEINSIHGHDAFLIEYSQLSKFLKPIFNPLITQNENHQLNHIWHR